MELSDVCVIGGSGFVGRHICHQLAARGYRVRVPTRDRERAKQLMLLPTVEVVSANIHDPGALAGVIRDVDAVINLVGVLHDGKGAGSFMAAHIELARKVVAACREEGVRRLLHMSALCAARDGPSAYLRSKGEAEDIVRASGLDVTVFRPSVIFGRDDTFLNLFAALLKVLPVVFLASPDARFQPVFVEDVAAAFVTSLEDPASLGQSYDLCGPKVYTLRELVEFAGRTTGRARPVIGLNDTLSYWQAFAMEWLPVKLMTRDNYYSMKVDSVCRCEFPFGLRPTALEAVAPAWLAQATPRARYRRFRDRAGR
ncbi:MAG: NAD-dependent dehydratase [Betaproteobacteria bacterium RIFCSPLOWO2_12_FULL_62_13]|nr:MAG: NAD-dependent dehydratase [Betaproteobacteria bacterium RIFCSPLOWO2_12_FULL_62_13]